MKLKKILVSMVVALGFVGLFGFATKEVDAASGYVFDGNQRSVVGLWIEVEGGTSGWAQLSPGNPNTNYNKTWSYNTQGKRWQAHVGINGTPEKWDTTIKSGWVNWQGNNIQINTAHHWLFGNQISVTP